MSAAMRYPIKLNDDYPCQGIDADGEAVYFPDLLGDGDLVGPSAEHDDTPGEAVYVNGVVVVKPDGLWVVARDA